MSQSAVPATPTRRSKRFQPLATPSRRRTAQPDCFWDGSSVYTRAINLDLDLLQDERDEISEDSIDSMQTVFYDSLSMKTQKAKIHNAAKKRRRAIEETQQVYHVGDTILIETDSFYRVRRPPSIAVIVAMWECRNKDEIVDEQPNSSRMRIRVHWFLRPTEMASIRAKRAHDQNEIYYSLDSSEVILPEVVVSRCVVIGNYQRPLKRTISPLREERKRANSVHSSENEGQESEEEEQQDSDETFICRVAVDSYRGLFYGFHWDAHRQSMSKLGVPEGEDSSWGSGVPWNVEIQEPKREPSRVKKQGGKKRRLDEDESDIDSEDEFKAPEDGGDAGDDDDDDIEMAGTDIDDDEQEEEEPVEPRTPSKKRARRESRRKATTTPRKRIKTLAQPTPHSKAAARRLQASPSKKKQKFTVRPRMLPSAMQKWNSSLMQLPQDPWLRAMHMLHVGNRPDSLPCRDAEFENVLRCVGEMLEEGSGGCVYISGVPGTGKTATVHSVVMELKNMAMNNETNPFTFVEINGLRLPEPSAAYNLLWEAISGHDVAKDGNLGISSKESLKALTRYFSGGAGRGPGGHACIVLMDELDQLVTNKQDVVYNFFNWPTLAGSKLVVIAVANTMDLPERVMSGRVRSRLGMIRINFQPYTRAQLETIVRARLASAKESLDDESQDVIEEKAITMASMKVSGISGDARRVLDICRRTVELAQSEKRTSTIKDVQEVFRAMQHNPIAAYLQDCSFHERLMLASLVKCMKREGVEEIKWGEIRYQHIVYMSVIPSDSDPKSKPTKNELLMVRDSLLASRAIIVEEGVAVSRKPEDERRVLLNIEQGEVERVLSDVGGNSWRNILCS